MAEMKEHPPLAICEANARAKRTTAQFRREEAAKALRHAEELDEEAAIWERAAQTLRAADA